MSRSVHSVKLNPYHSSQLSSLSYTLGDVVFDQDNQTLRVMDGASYGGNILANQAWTTNYINTVFSQAVLTVGNTTNSTGAYGTGALRIAGGLSIKKDTYMDGSLTVNTNLTVTGNLNATITTSSQTNITTLGTLTGLTSQGAVIITNNTATTQLGQGALQVSGGASIAGNLYVGGNLVLSGQDLTINSVTFKNGLTLSGTTTASTEFFTITNGALTPITNFQVDTSSGNTTIAGTLGVTGTITGNVTGNVTGTIQTAAQPNITSVGTLTSLNVTGAVTSGGVNLKTLAIAMGVAFG
jgi:cytoskeletal protein CcmA (bactofilin family)